MSDDVVVVPGARPWVIGRITQKTIDRLGLSIVPCGILIGPTNISHMQREHGEDYAKFSCAMRRIIAEPEFVAQHPRLKSIEFIRMLPGASEPILVAVRSTRAGVFFARSLYEMNPGGLDAYLKAGTAKPWQ